MCYRSGSYSRVIPWNEKIFAQIDLAYVLVFYRLIGFRFRVSGFGCQVFRRRLAKNLERRTSNIQHRTLNNDDAAHYRFYKNRTAEIRSLGSLPVFVVISAESTCSVFFFILREYLIGCWTFNVDNLVKSQNS